VFSGSGVEIEQEEVAVQAGYGALPHDVVARQLELLK
jgi:hypothetical protein